MRVELHDYRVAGPFNLELLNLSGNILVSYSNSFGCMFFDKLKSIDLSRNLLELLTPFPKQVLSLDLSGNYFAMHLDKIKGIFPKNLTLLCVSASLASAPCGDLARILNQDGEL